MLGVSYWQLLLMSPLFSSLFYWGFRGRISRGARVFQCCSFYVLVTAEDLQYQDWDSSRNWCSHSQFSQHHFRGQERQYNWHSFQAISLVYPGLFGKYGAVWAHIYTVSFHQAQPAQRMSVRECKLAPSLQIVLEKVFSLQVHLSVDGKEGNWRDGKLITEPSFFEDEKEIKKRGLSYSWGNFTKYFKYFNIQVFTFHIHFFSLCQHCAPIYP